MLINKRVLLATLLAATTTGFASAATATRITVTGIPKSVNANSTLVNWMDSFVVTGQGANGTTCNLAPDRNIHVSITRPDTSSSTDPSDSRIWSLALVSELAGKPVTVLVDDTAKDSYGGC